jgi:hypothetical protein
MLPQLKYGINFLYDRNHVGVLKAQKASLSEPFSSFEGSTHCSTRQTRQSTRRDKKEVQELYSSEDLKRGASEKGGWSRRRG